MLAGGCVRQSTGVSHVRRAPRQLLHLAVIHRLCPSDVAACRSLHSPTRYSCCLLLLLLTTRYPTARECLGCAARAPPPKTARRRDCATRGGSPWTPQRPPHRLVRSTSAFLQQMLEKRRPMPLMAVRAYMIFCLPSTLVFSTRRMCVKLSLPTRDCTGATRDARGEAQSWRRRAASDPVRQPLRFHAARAPRPAAPRGQRCPAPPCTPSCSATYAHGAAPSATQLGVNHFQRGTGRRSPLL